MKMAAENRMNFRKLLVENSRSFSLSLRCLPKERRDIVAATYLVARVADTIADSGTWPSSERLAYLEAWGKAVLNGNLGELRQDINVGSFSSKEAELLLQSRTVAEWFLSFDRHLRAIAVEVIHVLFQSMKWMIETFAEAKESSPKWGIQSEQEFDWYCFAHAGCVGIFWNRIFSLPANLEPLAINYGKALERINVLRDVVEDRRMGRLLLPRSAIETQGFTSDRPWEESMLWNKFSRRYCEETKKILYSGAQYCDSIGWGNFRLRWASMMPFKIGWKSLKLYEQEIDKTTTTKIPRKDVKRLATESLTDVLFNRKIHKRYINPEVY